MDLPTWIATHGREWLAQRITDKYEGGRTRSITRALSHASGLSHETVLMLSKGGRAGTLRTAHAIADATGGAVTALELWRLGDPHAAAVREDRT